MLCVFVNVFLPVIRLLVIIGIACGWWFWRWQLVGKKIFNNFHNKSELVGYGDFYPTTILGRSILFMVCIWGICLISLMVITITNLLSLNPLENKAMNLIMRLSKRLNLRHKAAEILTLTAKFSIHLKKDKAKNKKNETLNFVNSLKKKLNDFKDSRRCVFCKNLFVHLF